MAVSDYLKGSGSSSDPYIIHSVAAAVQFFSVDIFVSGVFAALVADIDLSAYTFNQTSSSYAILEGNGYSIKNLKHFRGNNQYSTFKRVTFINVSWLNSAGQQGGEIKFIDVVFMNGTLAHFSGKSTYVRCTLKNVSWAYARDGIVSVDSVVLPISSVCPTVFTDLRAVSDPYIPSRYLSFDNKSWVIDGFSPPRLFKQDASLMVRGYLVKGVVKIGGVTKPRFVRVLSAIDFARINDGLSGADGSFSLKCGFYSDVVMVATYEPYGDLPAVNKGYVLGDIIHPVTPNGFRYLCTKAGNSGATLPPEPWSTSAALTIGAAIFTPDPVYQPQLHGPIKPVLVDLITGQPV